MKNISINDSRAVFGKSEFTYQCVLDDFKNAKFIGIMTFNISPKADSHLLKSLKDACMNGTNAVIITNIPKRFPSYFKPQYAVAAKDMIDLYKQQLNPHDYGMRLSPYFTFHNHAKVVMTDNIIYWGSSNFSDESCGNIECGTISTDRELIKYLKDSLFPDVQNKSVPYYKYNFAVAIANLESLIPACKAARESLFNAAFEPWSDYDTNFEEKWIYCTTDSGINVNFLRGFIEFFSRFDDALNVIDNIIDEYWELDELPEQVEMLKGLFEEYKCTYASFNNTISSLFEELEQMAQYDVSDETCRKIINDYGMEAYDETLDYYIEKVMSEATEEYEELIKVSEQTVREALDSLDSMIRYFEQLNTSLHQLLEVNSKIDNTGVR
ncbi:hypothetical protein FMM68_04775 [Lachnospiraceae bacterium MD329]|nr:hypothetical protein [Lachnospiraceae bacterium MD329]